MKLFFTTIVSYSNSCYVKNFLITAENTKSAKILLESHERTEYKNIHINPKFVQEITEVGLTLDSKQKESVIFVSSGHNESNGGWHDD